MNLKSLWQKFGPDWKTVLRRGLPYALVAVFSAATVFAVMGVTDANQKYIAINSTKTDLQSQKQELDAALAQTKSLLTQLNTLNSDTKTLLQQAEKEGGVAAEKIEALKQTYENIEDKQRQQWVLPMQYKVCTSSYGYREHPVAGEGKFHYGVDLGADLGTPVVAARSGTVEIAEYLDDAGYWVLIDHMDGFDSRYMHMDKYIVTQGQFVVAGQIIGYCGSSGIATGNHLHFGIYKDNQVVNPADYIEFY